MPVFHSGSTRTAENVTRSSATWSASLKALARHDNVYVKIGGLGQRYTGLNLNERAEPPSSTDVAQACRPYVETCIEAFGPARSMFESNFPVDKPSYSYQVFWNACKLMTKDVSRSERAELFAGTATRFYRLSVRCKARPPRYCGGSARATTVSPDGTTTY